MSINHASHQPAADQQRYVSGCLVVPCVLALILGASWYWSTQHNPVHMTDWVKFEHVFHDNLSRSLEQGRGYELDFGDAEWVAGYSQQNSGGQYDWIFSVDAIGPSTAHSPAVPFLMSISRRFFGGEEGVVWGASALLFALALALLIKGMNDWFGWPVALIAALCLLLDIGLQQSSSLYSGDGLVTALMVTGFVLVIQGLNSSEEGRRSIWVWPAAGGLIGATTLFRVDIGVWLIILFVVWLCCITTHLVRRNTINRSLESFALFSIGVFVVSAPWWIHNCKTTGQFKPLGESLQINTVGAYSDAAISRNGNINPVQILRHRQKELILLEPLDLLLIEKEARLAASSVSRTKQWASDNPSQGSRLFLMKIGSHFGLISKQSQLNLINVILWVGALIGICVSWRRYGIVVFALVVASAIITGLTWSDHGRLFVPLRPLLDASFAIGLVYLIRLARPQKSRPAERQS